MARGDDVSVGREGSRHGDYRRFTDVLCIVLLQRVDPPTPPMAQKPFPNRPTPHSSRPPLGISSQSREDDLEDTLTGLT